jgi:hypothetical protein
MMAIFGSRNVQNDAARRARRHGRIACRSIQYFSNRMHADENRNVSLGGRFFGLSHSSSE